jgi:nucleotide-binding universal stress UspA family protein
MPVGTDSDVVVVMATPSADVIPSQTCVMTLNPTKDRSQPQPSTFTAMPGQLREPVTRRTERHAIAFGKGLWQPPDPIPPTSAGASALGKETTVGTWKTVLVGVDGSRGSRKALTWAAAEAATHGADLVVLYVWEQTLLPPAGSGSVPAGDVPDQSQGAAEDLLKVINEELGEDPPVLAQPRVKHGRPAEVLIEQSATVDLLVVGTRGHGGFAGLVLGSVSQHVAAYAQCSVTVVR